MKSQKLNEEKENPHFQSELRALYGKLPPKFGTIKQDKLENGRSDWIRDLGSDRSKQKAIERNFLEKQTRISMNGVRWGV
jgi:hypothetical protein